MKKEEIKDHLKNIGRILVEYLKGTAIDSLIIAVANLIFMLVMKMPFSILISVIVGITNIIPNVGPALGGLFGAMILFFKDPKMALWFLIFTVVLQLIDGLILKPKIFGKSFDISGVVILIVMVIAGFCFGIVGLVVCVPVVAIIKYIIKNIIQAKKEPEPEADTPPDEEE